MDAAEFFETLVSVY